MIGQLRCLRRIGRSSSSLVEGKSSWEIRNFRVSVMYLAEGRGGLRERGEEWEVRKELMVRVAESW